MKHIYLVLVALLSSLCTPAQINYCIPTYSWNCIYNDGITTFQLNTLYNNTGSYCPTSPGGYTNFAPTGNLTTSLERTESYTASVTIDNGGNGSVAIWIDYNDNGLFETSEKYHNNQLTPSNGTASIEITVPATAQLGPHRLRVREVYGSSPSSLNPCFNYAYGEVEDYTITITDAPVCGRITGVSVNNVTATGAVINFPCNGCNAIVEYGPVGFVPGSGTTPGTGGTIIQGSSPVSITTLSPNTAYSVYIRKDCGVDGISANSSAVNFTTACSSQAIPYYEGFELPGPAIPPCTYVQNLNNDQSTWAIARPLNYPGNVLRYKWHTVNSANDWFFTPGLQLSAGTSYTLGFRYGNNSSFFTEKMKVHYGNAPDHMAMTNQLIDLPNITGGFPRETSINFTPSSTGVYYIGFHAYSAADQFYLYLDSIEVNTSGSCSPVSSLQAFNTTSSASALKWTCNGCPGSFLVEYGVAGFQSGTGTILNTSDTLISISNLIPSTTYDAYVKQVCGAGEESVRRKVTFTTLPCAVPTNVLVDSIGTNSARVSWNCVDCAGSYIIEYGPQNFIPGYGNTPGTGGIMITSSGSPVTLTGLLPSTYYKVFVRQHCTGNSYSNNSYYRTFLTACSPSAVPYLENFNSAVIPSVPICTKVENANNDGNTWTTANMPSYGGKALVYRWNYNNAANDWFFTNGINLSAGTNYSISFRYGNTSTYYSEKLKVMYGSAASSSSMTETLIDLPNISGGQSNVARVQFTPATAGVFYFGFKAYSDANQLTLIVDSIKVDVTAGCLPVPNVTSTHVGSTSAKIKWPCNDCTGNYIVEYGLNGFTPGTGSSAGGGTFINVAADSILLTGLEPSTRYDVYVRQSCSNNTYSINQFTTFTTMPCTRPNGVSISNITLSSALVSWNCVNCQGNFVIEYGAAGFTPGTHATAGQGGTIINASSSPVTINNLNSSTAYQVYIRQMCTSGSWSMNSNVSNFSTMCNAVNIPYSENFDTAVSPALPLCTSVQDVNTDRSTWNTTQASGYTGNVLRYRWSYINQANDWFFTAPLNLSAGITYKLSFRYGNNSNFWSEKMKVAYGTSAQASAMVNPLVDLPNITGAQPQSTQVYFTPTTTGIFHIGFHAYSDPDQFYLFLDQISVEVSSICPAVTNITATAITNSSAALEWNCQGCTGNYIVEYGLAGFTPGTGSVAGSGGTIITVSQPNVTISGLTAGTTYDVFIRQACSSSSFSNNVQYSFGTMQRIEFTKSNPVKGTVHESGNSSVIVYPNPASSIINVRITHAEAGFSEVTIYDIHGRVNSRKSIMLQAGENLTSINVSTLPPGSYLLRLNGANKSIAVKFEKL